MFVDTSVSPNVLLDAVVCVAMCFRSTGVGILSVLFVCQWDAK